MINIDARHRAVLLRSSVENIGTTFAEEGIMVSRTALYNLF